MLLNWIQLNSFNSEWIEKSNRIKWNWSIHWIKLNRTVWSWKLYESVKIEHNWHNMEEEDLIRRYLTQLSGSFWQSILQRKRCHANHPMGGVRASPFSSATIIWKKLTTVKIIRGNPAFIVSTSRITIYWAPSLLSSDFIRSCNCTARFNNMICYPSIISHI